MLVEIESRPSVRGIRRNGAAAIAVSRIPFDMNPPAEACSVSDALDAVFCKRAAAGKSLSIILVAHSATPIHRTSFESIYGGELEIDYHAVVTPAWPDSVAALKSHSTLDVLVDDSRSMANGINAALSRAQGDVVIVIGDDFYPPPGWLEIVRQAFSLRPEMGVLGFSSVWVDGAQNIDVSYGDMTAFKALAARRRDAFARDTKLTDSLSALALAFDRRALQSVGGFDKKLGAGRWGIEDITMRMRRAGYAGYVAEDLFAHHFGPDTARPFLTDPVEEGRRSQIFAQKWKGRADFNPSRDFVALV
jgi:GT2 family glycosyltransferase